MSFDYNAWMDDVSERNLRMWDAEHPGENHFADEKEDAKEEKNKEE